MLTRLRNHLKSNSITNRVLKVRRVESKILGFTLIELLVVLAIVALLLTISFPR